MLATTAPSAAGLIIRAGDTLDAAGLDTDAIAAALDAANAADTRDTRDTYGAHYDGAIRRARNTIARRADRLDGTTVRVDGRAVTTTVTRTFDARGRLVPGAHADLARALHRIADALNDLLLRAH